MKEKQYLLVDCEMIGDSAKLFESKEELLLHLSNSGQTDEEAFEMLELYTIENGKFKRVFLNVETKIVLDIN